jgi:hypothetical protein
MLMPTLTSAIVETGNTSTNDKSIVLISNFFIVASLSSFQAFANTSTRSHVNHTVILPASLRYRFLSEMRVDVYLILGPVFVLWGRGSAGTFQRNTDPIPWSAQAEYRCGLPLVS